MGEVYKGEDLRLKRPVAIKFLSPTLHTDDAFRVRFLREAQTASALNHPNICTVYDVDEIDKELFLVMELVDGVSLRSWLDNHQTQDVSHSYLPSIDESIDIAVQLASGLSKAHERGIIHRDIKPENVMVTSERMVKIMDFGLARFVQETRLTRTGTALGTITYMAPEQIQGLKIDPRADIFSFGAVLYEILTLRKAFDAENEAVALYKVLNQDPLPIRSMRPDVSPDFERLILSCLAKDREQRPQSMADVLRDLRAQQALFRGGKVPVAPHALRKRIQLSELPWWVFLLGILVVVGLIVLVQRLRPASSAGSPVLTVTSSPLGASVYLDEILIGTTPITRHDLLPGSHRVRIQRDGFHRKDTALTALAGEDCRVGFLLEEVVDLDSFSTAEHVTGKGDRHMEERKHVNVADLVLVSSLEELALRMVQQFATQSGSKSASILVYPMAYEKSDFSGNLGVHLQALLEARLSSRESWRIVQKGEESRVSGAQVEIALQRAAGATHTVTGTYREEGGIALFEATFREVGIGLRVGSFRGQMPVRLLPPKLREFVPPHYKEAVQIVKRIKSTLSDESGLAFSAWTNRGSESLVFRRGERLRVIAQAGESCYVRILYFLANGEVGLVEDNRRVPGGSDALPTVVSDDLEIDSPFGAEVLQVLAQTQPFENVPTVTLGRIQLLQKDATPMAQKMRTVDQEGRGAKCAGICIPLTTLERD